MRRNLKAAVRLLAPMALALIALPQAAAFPFFQSENHEEGYVALQPRGGCAKYCGWKDMYCCGEGTDCITANGIAMCTAANQAWGIYTTTWTETRTYTSTVVPAQPLNTNVPCKPQNPGEIECGWVCCGSWQTCAWEGQCLDKPGMGPPAGGGGAPPATQTIVITTNGVVTTQYSAPYRVTSATITGVFTSGPASGTSVPITGGGGGGSGGGGLSPGAIAGIVIGVLAGIALLLLICFCCIARGLWNAIFGRKKDKHERERVEVVEERYSRHGSRVPSAHSRRTRHSGWFGGGGGGGHGSDHRNEKHSGGGKWLGIAAAAGTLLALLNLRKNKKPARKPRSGDSYTSYFYSGSGTSPSKSSPQH
jgi:hypothetical protein